MKIINHRNFLKTGIQFSAGVHVGGNSIHLLASPAKANILPDNLMAAISLPIQVVIDDVGWWSGHDGSINHEPYPSRIDRNHVPADYTAIVELGKTLNIRHQAEMVFVNGIKITSSVNSQQPTGWVNTEITDNRTQFMGLSLTDYPMGIVPKHLVKIGKTEKQN